jgi:hypothetical protein
MRCVACLFFGAVLLAGCGSPKPSPSPPKSKLIITPANASFGKVVSVNGEARFAVLNFPIGAIPPLGQLLNVYRQGLKVGELKVTGPQDDENTVANITNGDVRPGDEVRGN